MHAVFIVRCTFIVGDTRALTLFDDAMISMRYARNLVEHGVLTWNVGEPPIEGYTNLLWTLWMAVLHLLPLADLQMSFAVALTGIVLLLATGYAVTALVASGQGTRTAVVGAAIATWFAYPLVFWTLRGMEVGLLACLATAGGVATLRLLSDAATRRDLAVVCACMVAALLTRTDAVTFVGAWIVVVALWAPHRHRTRLAVTLVAVAGLTLAAHTLFRWTYYGAFMPNTYYLKLEGIAVGARIHRGVSSVARMLELGWFVPCVLACMAFASSQHRALKTLLALQTGGCILYSIYVGGDAWEELGIPNRYVSIALPSLFALAALGATAVARSISLARILALAVCLQALLQLVGVADTSIIQAERPLDADRTFAAMWMLVPAAILLVRPRAEWFVLASTVVMVSLLPWAGWARSNAAHVRIDVGRVQHGIAIRASSQEAAVVATVPCGSIPYFARRPTIDLLGKSDARIARQQPRTSAFHPGHVKWDNAYAIGERQPDLIDEIYIPADPSLVDADLSALPGWGYEQLRSAVYVRRDSTRVDRAKLLRLLDEVDN